MFPASAAIFASRPCYINPVAHLPVVALVVSYRHLFLFLLDHAHLPDRTKRFVFYLLIFRIMPVVQTKRFVFYLLTVHPKSNYQLLNR